MITLSQDDRTRIQDALRTYLKVTDQAMLDDITDDIAATGKIRVFGYGSLIKQPFAADDGKFDATLKGQVARFNCGFNFYGGTKEFPSLMLGLEDDENGSTP